MDLTEILGSVCSQLGKGGKIRVDPLTWRGLNWLVGLEDRTDNREKVATKVIGQVQIWTSHLEGTENQWTDQKPETIEFRGLGGKVEDCAKLVWSF